MLFEISKKVLERSGPIAIGLGSWSVAFLTLDSWSAAFYSTLTVYCGYSG